MLYFYDGRVGILSLPDQRSQVLALLCTQETVIQRLTWTQWIALICSRCTEWVVGGLGFCFCWVVWVVCCFIVFLKLFFKF